MLRSSVAILLLLSAVLGCTRDASTGATVDRTDSAGVAIVRSVGPDIPLGWRLVAAGRIDGGESSPSGGFDPVDGSIAADSLGRIFILDSDAGRVLVFDDSGRFLSAMGRPGRGPGEIGFAIAMAVAADGEVGVFDVSRRALVRFGPDGSPRSDLGTGTFHGGKIFLAGNGVLLESRLPDGGVVRRVHGEDTVSLAAQAHAPTKPIELASCGMSFSGMPPIFSPSLRWDASGPRVAIATGTAYDIQLFENDRLVRRSRRDIEPQRATHEMAVRELGEGMKVRTEGGVRVCDSDEVARQRGIDAVIPAVGRVALSPDGDLWVRRGVVRGDPAPIDVFAEDGAYIGSLPEATPFPAAFLPGDRIVVVEKDQDDVSHAVIYRVVRDGATR